MANTVAPDPSTGLLWEGGTTQLWLDQLPGLFLASHLPLATFYKVWGTAESPGALLKNTKSEVFKQK